MKYPEQHTHYPESQPPEYAQPYIDFMSSPHQLVGLLADFTPVVGGVKGAYEEAQAGNPGWAAFNAASVPADLLSMGLLGTAMRAGSKGRKAVRTMDSAKDMTERAKYIDANYYTHEDLFHGGVVNPNEVPFDTIDSARLGVSTNSPASKNTFWLSPDAGVADGYARNAKFEAAKRGEFDLQQFVSQWRIDKDAKIANLDWNEVLKEYPETDIRDPLGQELLAAHAKKAREDGADVIRVLNANDTVDGKSIPTFGILNPGKVKSKHGAYSPDFRNSNAPMLGAGGLAILGGLLGASSTETIDDL